MQHPAPVSLWIDESVVPHTKDGVRAHICRANPLAGERPSEGDWRSACGAGAILVRSGWRVDPDAPPAWLPAGWQSWNRFAEDVSRRSRELGVTCVVHPRIGDVLSDMASARVFLASVPGDWSVLLDPGGLLDSGMLVHAEDHLTRILDGAGKMLNIWGLLVRAEDPSREYMVRAIRDRQLALPIIVAGEATPSREALVRLFSV